MDIAVFRKTSAKKLQKITYNQKNNSQMKKKCLRMDIAVFRKTSAKKLQKITYNQKNNSQ